MNLIPVIAMAALLHPGAAISAASPGNLPLCPAVSLSQGESVTIPGYEITDTGTYRYNIKWEVNPSVAGSWISGPPVLMESGQTRTLTIRVSVPLSAPDGEYFAELEAYPYYSVAGKAETGKPAELPVDFSVGVPLPSQCQAAKPSSGPSAKTIVIITLLGLITAGALVIRRRMHKQTKADGE